MVRLRVVCQFSVELLFDLEGFFSACTEAFLATPVASVMGPKVDEHATGRLL